MGLVLTVAVTGGIFVLIYVALLSQVISGDARIPGGAGPVAYALLHGGAVAIEVPPIPALFGLGGDLKLGLPLLSFALLPFIGFLAGSRLLARKLGSEAGSSMVLSVVAAISYGIIVGVVALLGGISLDASAGDSISLSAVPFSAALWAALLALLGSALGASVFRGTWWPVWARQATRGALWAVGVSVATALVTLTVVAVISQGGGQGEVGAPVSQAPQELVPPEISGGASGAPEGEGSSGGDGVIPLAAVGAFFALLPAMLGNLWLVAHGLPVGVQNAPDLSQLPMFGTELANLPLSVSLLGDWPLGGEWRLLLLSPVVGLMVGGMISARGARAPDRWWRGALVSVPYTIIALVVALAVGLSASISLMNVETSLTLRASLPWLLLLLLEGAAFGATGSLLARREPENPRPNLAFRTAFGISAVLLLGSFPLLAAPLALSSQGSDLGQTPGAPPPTTMNPQPEESSIEGGGEDAEIQLSDTAPDDPPAEEFDDLLPILKERTDAPIMLPAILPDQLENVAVDDSLEGEEYGILFQGEPTGNDLDTFVGANSVGTMTVEPAPGSNTDNNEFFESIRTEDIELPDGTPATLSYMKPSGTPGNQGPYWEGEFERDGYLYTLIVEVADFPGEAAGRTLSSMVFADEESEEESEEPVGSEAELRQAVEEYYLAAGAEEWNYTYENLDSETQSMFTEEEWYQKNQYFADLDSTIYHLLSVELDENSREPIAEVRLRLTGEDGSSRIRTTYFVWEEGAWRHRFGQEEIGLFRPGSTYVDATLNF